MISDISRSAELSPRKSVTEPEVPAVASEGTSTPGTRATSLAPGRRRSTPRSSPRSRSTSNRATPSTSGNELLMRKLFTCITFKNILCANKNLCYSSETSFWCLQSCWVLSSCWRLFLYNCRSLLFGFLSQHSYEITVRNNIQYLISYIVESKYVSEYESHMKVKPIGLTWKER